MRFLLALSGLVFSATTAQALTITVAPGQNCVLATTGSHICQWLGATGEVASRASVRIWTNGKNVPNELAFDISVSALPNVLGEANLPIMGAVTAMIPYEMTPHAQYGFGTEIMTHAYIRQRPGFIQGDVNFVSGLTVGSDLDSLYDAAYLGGYIPRGKGWLGSRHWVELMETGGSWVGGMKWNTPTVRLRSLSLYSAAVIPEPATWAMMIAGFGMIGMAARRRRLATA